MNKFTANRSRQSTYACRCCGHVTRETGKGEQGVDLCGICYDICGLENQISDGDKSDATARQLAALQASLIKRNSSTARA